MTSFLREELGVAMSGVKWDVAGYKLWQSVQPDVILFTPKQPVLAKGDNGRYQCAVTQFRQQADDTYKITGGSAIFTITSAIQHSAAAFKELKEQWMTEMTGLGPRPPSNPRFVPLNVQKGTAQVLINPVSGVPNQAHTDANIGTPGGTNSFLVELTELGAQEWASAIREGKAAPAGVKMMYEYLRMLPSVGARVTVFGRRMFQHISTELNVSYNGFFYGGSVNIEAAWEKMVRLGIVKIEFIGQLDPTLEEIRKNLVTTFADQARTQLFDSLFQPKPDIEEAQAGDTRGLFGGANFAFKYRREEEVTDLKLELRFEGWTWLKASMDANLTTLFADLDDSYVHDVNTQMSAPASIVIDSDPLLEQVAVSWTASEGQAPQSPIFGSEGGNVSYVVTSPHINDVQVDYRAKVNFAPARWPIIETTGSARMGAGGNQIAIKPASWVGRHMIYMFVSDGDKIKVVDIENDYLIVNVSFEGPHLSRAISESARITPLGPIEFSYPLSPEGRGGKAKFSAFGVIGGRLVRSAEQPINLDEEAVFILASPNDVQLVSQASILPERSLASRLRAAGARPVIDGAPATEARPRPTTEHARRTAQHNGANGGVLTGTLVGVEYSGKGAALLVENDRGVVHIPLRHAELADRLDDERKRVRIVLDEQSYGKEVTVEL